MVYKISRRKGRTRRHKQMIELIDRKQLIEKCAWTLFDCWKVVSIDDIMKFPTVDAKPVKHGRWIDMQYPLAGHTYISCSECGEGLAIDSSYKSIINYCPSCGADMRGEEDGR